MGLYLIGLGLDVNSISVEAAEALKTCEKIYLEGYTVDYPYDLQELKDSLGQDFEVLSRENVEDESIVTLAQKKDVALLVYGDCLSATTHIQLILSCKEKKIPYKIFHNASILLAISRTGLSLYKFGKIASLPDWKIHTNKPISFIDYIIDNKQIGAHSLLLCDIGLDFKQALEQLQEATNEKQISIENIIVIEHAGTKKEVIHYEKIDTLKEKHVTNPYCIILPGELGHFEKEALEELCVR